MFGLMNVTTKFDEDSGELLVELPGADPNSIVVEKHSRITYVVSADTEVSGKVLIRLNCHPEKKIVSTSYKNGVLRVKYADQDFEKIPVLLE